MKGITKPEKREKMFNHSAKIKQMACLAMEAI